MPKLIDAPSRRYEIATAVWRIVARDGVSAVSIRDVAAEAGLAVGSVRHVFGTKAELLEYSMAQVHRDAAEHIAAAARIRDPRSRCEAMLAELLPLDERRATQMAVHVSVLADGPAHPGLRRVADDAHAGIAGVCRAVLTILRDAALLPADADPVFETRRLHALIDGLALHGMTIGPRRLMAVLRGHLDALAPTS